MLDLNNLTSSYPSVLTIDNARDVLSFLKEYKYCITIKEHKEWSLSKNLELT